MLRQKINSTEVSPNGKYSLVEELPDLQDKEVKTNSWKLFYLSLICSFQRVYNSSIITPGALHLLSHTRAHIEPSILWCLRLVGFISESIHLVKDALIASTVSINLLLSSDNCRRWWLQQPSPSSADGKKSLHPYFRHSQLQTIFVFSIRLKTCDTFQITKIPIKLILFCFLAADRSHFKKLIAFGTGLVVWNIPTSQMIE